MNLSQLGVIGEVLDSQLADFRARRLAAEHDYDRRCAQFGDVVVPNNVIEIKRIECSDQTVLQPPFLQSASESMPGESTDRPDVPTRSDESYRGTLWLRRASD